MSASAHLLPDGQRLHLQHGPIDLIIGVEGDRSVASAAAKSRFATVLDELVPELPLLRSAVGPRPAGGIARRMHRAVLPFGPESFVTPMAAVAGAVADEVLQAILAATPVRRAYVNNGGDIAFHLAPGTSYRLAVASPVNRPLGAISVAASDPVRGIATSGAGGRSLSLGIADAVTVLALDAAAADVAATLIANAVDLPGHPAIRRSPAVDLHPDSDLGTRLVTTSVGPLSADEVAAALARGASSAARLLSLGRIHGAALFLRGQSQVVGAQAALAELAARGHNEPQGLQERMAAHG